MFHVEHYRKLWRGSLFTMLVPAAGNYRTAGRSQWAAANSSRVARPSSEMPRGFHAHASVFIRLCWIAPTGDTSGFAPAKPDRGGTSDAIPLFGLGSKPR